MKRLVDLEPRWNSSGPDRHGMGITFLSPNTGERVGVAFTNPVDGGPPYPAVGIPERDRRWTRSGTTFEDLTISPSIDAYEPERDEEGKLTGRRTRTIWHGIVSKGWVR